MQDCERQLLAAWISGDNQEHIKEFDNFMFYPEIFEAVKKLKKVDILTVAEETKIRVADIAKLSAEYIPAIYDGYYKRKKKEKINSMLIEAAKHPDNIEQDIAAIQNEIDSLDATNIRKPSDPCEAYKKELERRTTSEPLKYGIPKLDTITGGARGQELTVIAARPRIGKTALALQFAFEAARKKNKVLYFPLEMSTSQMMERLTCRETNIGQEKLKAPKLMDESDWQALDYFFKLYKPVLGPYLHFIEHVRTLTEIKRHIEHYKPKVVIIDQLSQLREHRRFNSVREQFTYMTNTLKEMTMELDVPIILLAQISRSGDGKEPTLADLKESGSIEEDADNIFFIHKTDETDGNKTPVSIIVPKQRNGICDVRIPCMYYGNRYKFIELGK